MAKKTTKTEVIAESKWDGRLLTYIGIGLLELLVIAIMAGIGVAIAYAMGAFNENPDQMMQILGFVVIGVCAMVGFCWACIIYVKWDSKHTVISGQRLKFTANTFNLVCNIIKWTFLTVITVGIYGLWMPIKVRKWQIAHTVSEPEENAYGVGAPQITYYTVDDED